MVGWSENLLLLSVPSKLTRENLLLDVGVRTDFRNLEGNTLVHHLRIQILTLDLLAIHVT